MMLLIALKVLIMLVRHFSSVMNTASTSLMIRDMITITITIRVNKL